MKTCKYKPIPRIQPKTRNDIVKVKPVDGVVIVYNLSLEPLDESSGRFKVNSTPVIVQNRECYQIIRNYQPVREFVLVDEVEHV